ncbi:4471_t:CDS:2, partial [Acaulospora morrowiae]
MSSGIITSYLNQRRNKSFWGFLCRYRDTIVATTSTTSAWRGLNDSWSERFLAESKGLLNPTDFDNLEKQVCSFLFCKGRVTPSPLLRHPNFVVGKGLLIPEVESVMCLWTSLYYLIPLYYS